MSLVGLGKRTFRIARFLVKAAPISFPKLVECNVCGWQGRHFLSDGWHKHSICPKCRGGVRHRLLIASLERVGAFSFERLVKNKNVLHFAPEEFIQRRLVSHAATYTTADLFNPRRDLQIDISDMPSVESEFYDLVIACDVLEHVPNDRRAMCELVRVLRPAGFAILTVPQQDYLETTFEDPEVTDPDERLRRFGQSDHLRIYGDDFPQLLEAAGFRVTSVDESCFSADSVERQVLAPPERSTRPLATNFRKVFFAQKC